MMYDERVSQEDMDRVYEQGYKKGYKDGAESERPRAFGAGYKAGYDNASKLVRCKDCMHKYVTGDTTQYYVCDFMDAQFDENGYCHHGER